MFLHSISTSSSLLYNIHSSESRARTLDSLLDCFYEGARNGSHTDLAAHCAVVTDYISLVMSISGPSAILYFPVSPANNLSSIVGIVSTSIVWKSVLDELVPTDVDGLVCVISTSTLSYTWTLKGGTAKLEGEGNLHNKRF